MVVREEADEDLARVKLRRIIYMAGGIGMLVLCVGLLVLYFTRHELPALLLGTVAFIWAVLLVYQSFKTREIIIMIEHHLAAAEAEGEHAEEMPSPASDEEAEHPDPGGGGSGEP